MASRSPGRTARQPATRCALIGVAMLLLSARAAQQVPVAHLEGLVHGFLTLRTLTGERLADGDLVQNAHGARVTSRLTFHFHDGSLHDETAVFSQDHQFRLISDHLVQKGPAFPQPIDMEIDAVHGQVTVRYEDHGKPEVATEHMDLPPDLANGIILTLLKNARPQAPPKSVGFVAATPKPMLVKLAISTAGDEAFSTGAIRRRATHYVLKVDIGGITGFFASLFGKTPPDSHVWILGGDAPAFVESEQPLYNGGPLWRIQLASPTGPK